MKVSSFWRGFSWSRKLDSRYTSEEETAGALFPIITTLSRDFEKYLYLKSIYSSVQIGRYFSNSHDSIMMALLAPGEECHLDFCPKSCTYPTLATIDPPEVKIISILLYKDSNCPMLYCTFTIDNSLFLTTVKKKMFCVSLFSVKEFLIYKSKLLSFLQRLYNMSRTTYIHDLLPVTWWRHSMTQTWLIKHWQYLGMKL